MDEAALARAVLEEGKLVLADVVFPWCGPSTAWKRDFTIAAAQAKKPDAQIHRHDEVVFAYIDATEHRYLGRRLGAECGSRPVKAPLPPSDSSQFLSTCSSLPLVLGCSNLAC